MPTPFTHLAYAQRLLTDDKLPEHARQLLQDERPAFLLGSIAADAQTIYGLTRETTHFYSYDQPLETPPYQVMLLRYPELCLSDSGAQRAFVAGYVVHLSIDEIWSQQMIYPYFVAQEWGTRLERFLALQLLLITMDERDRETILPETTEALAQAMPGQWLPFLSDAQLERWRNVIERQLAPGGQSETLNIISERAPENLGLNPAVLRNMVDSSKIMEHKLWCHVPQSAVYEIEMRMYEASRERLGIVLQANF